MDFIGALNTFRAKKHQSDGKDPEVMVAPSLLEYVAKEVESAAVAGEISRRKGFQGAMAHDRHCQRLAYQPHRDRVGSPGDLENLRWSGEMWSW